MDDAQFAGLASWIAAAGLEGSAETAMVAGFCERLKALGVPLTRASVFIDTLHPTYEGRIFSWQSGGEQTKLTEYGRTGEEGDLAERWRRSPFYRLLAAGETVMRRSLSRETDADLAEFPIFADLRAAGMTEYLAMVTRFAGERSIGRIATIRISRAQGNGLDQAWQTVARRRGPQGGRDGYNRTGGQINRRYTWILRSRANDRETGF